MYCIFTSINKKRVSLITGNGLKHSVLLFLDVFKFVHDLSAHRLQLLHGKAHFIKGYDFGFIIVIDILPESVVVQFRLAPAPVLVGAGLPLHPAPLFAGVAPIRIRFGGAPGDQLPVEAPPFQTLVSLLRLSLLLHLKNHFEINGWLYFKYR